MQRIVASDNIDTLFHVKGEKSLTLQTDYSALRILLFLTVAHWRLKPLHVLEQAYVRGCLKIVFLQTVFLH